MTLADLAAVFLVAPPLGTVLEEVLLDLDKRSVVFVLAALVTDTVEEEDDSLLICRPAVRLGGLGTGGEAARPEVGAGLPLDRW